MSAYELKVRTAERPMAFTRAELWRGARNTWCVFMVLMNLGLVLMMVTAALVFGNGILELPILLAFTLGYASVFGGGISLIVMIAGAPIAGLVGKALQHDSRILVHLPVYGALGLLIAGSSFIAATRHGQTWTLLPKMPSDAHLLSEALRATDRSHEAIASLHALK